MIEAGYLAARDSAARKLVAAKIACCHEAETIRTESEMKIRPAGSALEAQAASNRETATRGQGRPAAIIIGGSPTNPGRSPDRIGRPAPAQPRVPKPAAIMKRRPAPGIIGHPIPAAVGVNPATTVEIRLPARILDHYCRLPAATITLDVQPGTVRREGIVKYRCDGWRLRSRRHTIGVGAGIVADRQNSGLSLEVRDGVIEIIQR